MSNPFQEQLLKAGLVDAKRVQKARSEKHKEHKQQNQNRGKNAPPAEDAAARRAAEQAERDRQLNLQRKREAEEKEKQAQVKQMIEAHRVAHGRGERYYNFTEGSTVRRLEVTPAQHSQLARGQLGIVSHEGGHALIPRDTALKIRERLPEVIIVLHEPDTPTEDENDPYAAYKVPDDLMW